ncbi:PREDICTED: olfactory receptor 1019-like [Nanorana parkeri]|uniref:olfactory receptor 1019-like n=1 Tax=Nanorana parkeri TaxID=125878 RepID=UPI000854CAE3|nr:PREDICTED: olfactory receptor 1019-like [Nanorana parkeri]
MRHLNKTQVTMFVFSGLTDNEQLAPFLFTFFLSVYLVCVVFNFGMMFIILKASNLQTPMYYFLSYLSLVDLFYSSVITPKMLADLMSKIKFISFYSCAVQFFFFDALAVTEAFLLSSMSYDRYVAICRPLLYVSVMTSKKCLSLVFLCFSIGFLQSVVQTSCVFSLEFCGPNFIDHFYCDVPPLLILACSSTLWCDSITFFFVSACGIGSLMTILVSYTFIVTSIIQIKSSKGRQKAFGTCSSHLMCISIFYGTVFFIYLRPPNSAFENQDKSASVFYTVMIPMLNPLIYSLRNQEVKRAIKKALHICP